MTYAYLVELIKQMNPEQQNQIVQLIDDSGRYRDVELRLLPFKGPGLEGHVGPVLMCAEGRDAPEHI